MRSKVKLNVSDYYDVGLILLFSLYAYFFLGEVFSIFSDFTSSQELSIFYFLTCVVPMIIALLFLYKIKKNDFFIGSKYKITSIKSFMLLSISIVVIIIFDGNIDSISTSEIIRLLPLSLNIVAAELIFRVLLFSIVFKIFGNGKVGISLSILLSCIPFILILSPFQIDKIFLLVFAVVSFSCLAYYSGSIESITYISIFDTWLIIKTVDNYNLLSLIIITLVLYFTIAIPIHFIQKQKQKENVIQT